MKIPNGTYQARSMQQSCYEAKTGALVVAFEFKTNTEPSVTLTGYQTLVNKDGEVKVDTIKNLKDPEVFGWDGVDPVWFNTADLSEKMVDIVVENEPYTDPQTGKTRDVAKVKWINPVGGGGVALPAPYDPKAIANKYGAKFRALAGGVAIPAKKPAAKNTGSYPAAPATAPTAPTAPAEKPGPTVPIIGKKSTQDEAWLTHCTINKGQGEEALNKGWFEQIAMFNKESGKKQEDMTPEDWAKFQDFLTGDIPF